MILWACFDHGIYNWKVLLAGDSGALPRGAFCRRVSASADAERPAPDVAAAHRPRRGAVLRSLSVLQGSRTRAAIFCSRANGAPGWSTNGSLRCCARRSDARRSDRRWAISACAALSISPHSKRRRDPKDPTLSRHARSLEDRLKRERSMLFDPPPGTWLLPLPVLKILRGAVDVAHALGPGLRRSAALRVHARSRQPAGMAAAVSVRRDLHDRCRHRRRRVRGVANRPLRAPAAARSARGRRCGVRRLLHARAAARLCTGLRIVSDARAPTRLEGVRTGRCFHQRLSPRLDRAGRQPPNAVGIGHDRRSGRTRSAAGRRSAAPRDRGRATNVCGGSDRTSRSEIGTGDSTAPGTPPPLQARRVSRDDGEIGRRARRASPAPARLDECARQAGESTIRDPAPVVQAVKDEFDRLAGEVLDAAAKELDAIAALEQAYGRAWSEIMQDLDAHDALRRRLKTPLRLAWQAQNDIALGASRRRSHR